MVKPEVNPAFLIRSYVWQLLKRNDHDTWDESKYGGLIPIVPLAEEPDLGEYSGPRIVYGYSGDNSTAQYARKYGSMAFAVYDDNFRRLTKTLTILDAALGRFDDAAKDVNKYTSTKPAFLGVRFGYIRASMLEGGQPETQEGGRQSAVYIVSYEYYADYDVITDVTQ